MAFAFDGHVRELVEAVADLVLQGGARCMSVFGNCASVFGNCASNCAEVLEDHVHHADDDVRSACADRKRHGVGGLGAETDADGARKSSRLWSPATQHFMMMGSGTCVLDTMAATASAVVETSLVLHRDTCDGGSSCIGRRREVGGVHFLSNLKCHTQKQSPAGQWAFAKCDV